MESPDRRVSSSLELILAVLTPSLAHTINRKLLLLRMVKIKTICSAIDATSAINLTAVKGKLDVLVLSVQQSTGFLYSCFHLPSAAGLSSGALFRTSIPILAQSLRELADLAKSTPPHNNTQMYSLDHPLMDTDFAERSLGAQFMVHDVKMLDSTVRVSSPESLSPFVPGARRNVTSPVMAAYQIPLLGQQPLIEPTRFGGQTMDSSKSSKHNRVSSIPTCLFRFLTVRRHKALVYS
ncbi:unnamed protein product [Protopolystoma xenopodis]|uniref:Uncharacterized protein n=1 Tax=Protopolystoma xenopodis TaxID=117903 RepID=A0A3S5CML5_9PLAT|nr:unnamed protein product [Protopolystoma xenopodis]